VKSGYQNRGTAPIDLVPDAGARTGKPDGIETTSLGIGVNDLESGDTVSPSSPPPYFADATSPNRSVDTL